MMPRPMIPTVPLALLPFIPANPPELVFVWDGNASTPGDDAFKREMADVSAGPRGEVNRLSSRAMIAYRARNCRGCRQAREDNSVSVTGHRAARARAQPERRPLRPRRAGPPQDQGVC